MKPLPRTSGTRQSSWREHFMREWVARFARGTGVAVLGLVVLGFGGWGALLLAFAGPTNEVIRAALVLGFCVASAGTLIAIFVRRWRWRAGSAFAALCA